MWFHLSLVLICWLHLLTIRGNILPSAQNIYVDLDSDSTSPDGSQEKPYKQLADALDEISRTKQKGQEAHTNLFLAPSLQNYTLRPHHSFNGENLVGISISAWHERMIHDLPVLEFTDSLLTLNNLVQFELSDLNIFGNNGSLIIENTGVILKNLIFQEPFGTVEPFFTITNPSLLNVSGVNVTLSRRAVLMKVKVTQDVTSLDVYITDLTFKSTLVDLGTHFMEPGESLFTFDGDDRRNKKLFLKNVNILADSEFKIFSELYSLCHTKFWGSITASNINIRDQEFSVYKTTILFVEDAEDLNIDNLTVSGNQVSMLFPTPLFLINSCQRVDISNLNFKNNKIAEDGELSRGSKFYLTSFSNVNSIMLRNHLIESNTFGTTTRLFYFPNFEAQDLKSKLVNVSCLDMTFINNTVKFKIDALNLIGNTFSFLEMQGSLFASLIADNINFLDNKLSGRLFAIQSQNLQFGVKSGTLAKPLQLNVSRVNILDNLEISDFSFLYFFPLEDMTKTYDCSQLLEIHQLYISELRVINNRFRKALSSSLWLEEVDLFQIKETQIFMVDSVIKDNTFESYNFLTLDRKPSTLQFINNQVANNTLRSSTFINSYYQSQDNPCIAIGDRIVHPTMIKFRYGFVVNSTFSDISIEDGALLKIDNGFINVHDNNFRNITLQDSTFIESFHSPISLPSNSLIYTLTPITKFYALQSNILTWQMYNETIATASQNKVGEMCYYSMADNILIGFKLANSKFVSLSGYGSKQGYISIDSNILSEFEYQDKVPVSMVSVDSLYAMVVIGNTLRSMTGNFSFSSISQSQRVFLLAFNANSLSNINATAFLIFQGPNLQAFEFNRNLIYQVTFSLACLNLNIDFTDRVWFIQNNAIIRSILSPDLSISHNERYGFIYISIRNTPRENQLRLDNNVFQEIKLIFMNDEKTLAGQTDFIIIETYQVIKSAGNLFENFEISTSGSLLNFLNSPTMTLLDSTFRNITFNSQAGLIKSFSQNTRIFNCTFEIIQNEGNSGIIYLTPATLFYRLLIENCRFEKLLSKAPKAEDFSLIFNIRTKKQERTMETLSFEFKNCSVQDLQDGLVFYLSGINCLGCTIKNSSFIATSANAFGMGLVKLVDRMTGSFWVENSSFPVNLNTRSYLIEVQFSFVDFIINNLVHISNQSLFTLAKIDSGSFTLKNSVIENCSLSAGNPMISIISQGLYTTLPDLMFRNASFQNVNFSNINYLNSESAKYSSSSKSRFVEILNYQNLLDDQSAIIYGGFQLHIEVKSCIFENFTDVTAILYRNSSSTYPAIVKGTSIKIQDTRFTELKSVVGPGLTVLSNSYKPKVAIINSIFENNRAYAGGAMAVYDCTLALVDSKIINNTAEWMASAILRDFNRSFIVNNINSKISGTVGSEASRFTLGLLPGPFRHPNLTIASQCKDGNCFLSVANMSVYELQDSQLIIELIDALNEDVSDISPYKEVALIVPRRGDTKKDKITVSATWTSGFRAVLSLKGVVFDGLAGETVMVGVQYTSSRLSILQTFPFLIRPCMPGEQNNSMTCQPCGDSTYSIDPNESCDVCPVNALCPDQSSIHPIPGYWNPNTNSTAISKCRSDDIQRCENANDRRSCVRGYDGPLCNACDFEAGYVENGYLKCAECTSESKSLAYSLVLGLLYIGYQLFSIDSMYEVNQTLEDGTEYLKVRQREKSFYIKGLLTYTQLMSMLILTNPQIVSSVGLTFKATSPIERITFGTQCTLKALGIHYNEFIYYETLVLVSTPIVQFLVIVLLAFILKIVKNKIHFGKFIIASLVYMVISHQPNLISNLARFLSCSQTPGVDDPYITSHPFWSCSDDRYQTYTKFIVKPTLLIWCLVIPLIIFFVLKIKKDKLSDDALRIPLGVFYFDLQDRFYYWGIILMVLKLVLSALAYELEQTHQEFIIIALLLLWLYQTLLRQYKPYQTPAFNNFEILLINLLMFNIVVTRYLLSSEKSVYITNCALVSGLAFNLGFVLVVVWKIASLTYLSLVSMFEKKVLKRRVTKRVDIMRYSELSRDQNNML